MAGGVRPGLHALARLDADQVEAARDDRLGRAAKAEPERLRVGLEDAMLVVEAMKVVGDPDRVERDRVGRPSLGRLGRDSGELREPLDQVALLDREVARSGSADRRAGRVPEDARNARVRVLDVVDGILLRALRGEVDVDVDRLVGPARDQVPARGVDADRVDQLAEEDDVPAPLRSLLRLTSFDDVDELVDRHLDAIAAVAEPVGERLQARDVAVVIGREHVDDPVEPALELVPHVRRVAGEVGEAAVGADDDPILVVAVRRRPHPAGAVLLVGRERLERLRDLRLEVGLADPDVDVDPELLELPLDQPDHLLDGIARELGDLRDVLAHVTALGGLLPPPPRLDRLAEELDLAADVVEVALAHDLAAAELEEARDRVAVRAVPRRADDERAGGIRGNELDEDALALSRLPGAVALAALEDLREGPLVPVTGQPQVEEAGARDLGPLDRLQPGSAAGQLLGDLSRGTLPHGSCAKGDVGRVVAVTGIARPLQLHLRPCDFGELLGEALDGVRAHFGMITRRLGPMDDCEGRTQGAPIAKLWARLRTTHRTVQRGQAARASLRNELLAGNGFPWGEQVLEQPKLLVGAGRDQHVAGLELRLRRRGRVERPVLLPEGDDERAGFLADVDVLDRLAGLAAGLRDLDLLEAQVSARRSRDHVDERGHLRLEDEVRHHSPRRRVRLDDAVRPCELELPARVLVRRPRHDQDVRLRGPGRERDVEVVRVVVRGGDEPARPLQACLAEIVVARPIALDEEDVLLGGGFLRGLAEVEDDERHVRLAELLGDAPADTTEPADDVVVAQPLQRSSHPPLRPHAADDPAGDRLDDEGTDVGKDTDAREHDEDRDDAGAVVLRDGVEAGEGARDERPVERLQPRLAQAPAEAERAEQEHDAECQHGVDEAARMEGLHTSSIVGSWTATPKSASLTSTSTPSRWPGSMRTSRTSRSRSTSSRLPSRGSTTSWRRATSPVSSSRV